MAYQVKDKADFDKQVKNAGERVVLVTFYATWCGPSKLMALIIEEMVKEIPEVIFFRVDVNKCEDLVLEYNISCVPTFIFLKNGNKVAELFGAHEDQLRALIKQHK